MCHYTAIDKLLIDADHILKTIVGNPPAERPSPGRTVRESALTEAERRHSAGLIRVDHVGEVCAQALYQGQALVARKPDLHAHLKQAAQEENDHLAWCYERLQELGSRPSYLNPAWYLGSLAIGIAAGLAGDSVSLGFVAQTECQVEEHLENHLERLPPHDHKSRRIVAQMKIDERKHATHALERGGIELPLPIKLLMRATSKVMTTVAYWL